MTRAAATVAAIKGMVMGTAAAGVTAAARIAFAFSDRFRSARVSRVAGQIQITLATGIRSN